MDNFLLDLGIFHCYVRLLEGNMEPQKLVVWGDVSPVSLGYFRVNHVSFQGCIILILWHGNTSN